MDDKELYEILQKYVEETRGDKDVDLKKLHEKQLAQEEIKNSKTKNRFKPQYVFVAAMCVIVIALCIALPVTLTDKSQNIVPTFCESDEIEYEIEDSISSIINTYHINAYYPTCATETEDMVIYSILSKKDESLHGVQISYVVEKEGIVLFIDFAIVPKTHILQTYENYFSLQNKLIWTEYDVKFFNEYDEEMLMNNMQIYFTDRKYDYFISVESDDEIGPADILDILYS